MYGHVLKENNSYTSGSCNYKKPCVKMAFYTSGFIYMSPVSKKCSLSLSKKNHIFLSFNQIKSGNELYSGLYHVHIVPIFGKIYRMVAIFCTLKIECDTICGTFHLCSYYFTDELILIYRGP